MDVVSLYVDLKKTGMYWKGRCPFHYEKTGSFAVSPHRDIFYCFGCHKGGDSIAFIAEIEHCSQLEAARYLADRFSLELPQETLSLDAVDQNAAALQRYTQLCLLVAQWCHEQLKVHPVAHNYIKTRGFTDDTLKLFQIGYFPETGLTSLLDYIKKHNYLAQDLIQAHVLQEGKFGLYSSFSERIIFPIRDHLGRVCGFGARVFKPEDTRAKYYNSQDHVFFSKGHVLYGLHSAKKVIQEKASVFLVEGYLDCIAMVQAGYTNTVAILGTACTAEHLKILARYASHIYVLYDGDKAGHQAVLKLTQLAWSVHLDILVIQLPENEDPASFLAQKSNSENNNLNTLIAQAHDIFSFFIQSLGSGYAAKPLQEKLHLVQACITAVSNVNDSLKQNVLLHKASSTFDIPIEVLADKVTTLTRNFHQGTSTMYGTSEAVNTHVTADTTLNEVQAWEQALFAQLLINPGLLDTLDDDDKELIKRRCMPLIFELIEHFLVFVHTHSISPTSTPQQERPVLAAFLESLSPDAQKLATCLIVKGEEHPSFKSITHILETLWKKEWKIIINNVKMRLKMAESAKDQVAIKNITTEFIELKNKMKEKGIL